MATDTWTYDATANWDTPSDWSLGLPDPSSDVVISTGNPEVTASFGTVGTLKISSVNAALTFLDAGASSVTGGVTNVGSLGLDSSSGDGGSSLTIGGKLTNDGTLQIGPGDLTLSAASTVYARNLANLQGTAYGTIYLYGSSTAEATLDVGSAAGFGAAGVLYGGVSLSDDALIEFKSGQIATIAADSALSLNGPNALVADASDTGSNSALKGLGTVAGSLGLYDGATVTTSGALTVSGSIDLAGDTGLTTLDVGSAAGFGGAGTLHGDISLYGNALVEFQSGQIAAIAGDGLLSLNGSHAVMADASDTSTNSALNGLNRVAGGLILDDGALVATSGGLTNSGTVLLDAYLGDGGSALTIGGTLTNSGTSASRLLWRRAAEEQHA